MPDKYTGKVTILVLFLLMNICVDLPAANLPSHNNRTKPTALASGTLALPTVYLIGRDGRIVGNEFLWERDAEEGAILGRTPLFADAVKSLLTPEVSNNLHQYSSCVGGTVVMNEVPVEDFSCSLKQIQGQKPGMRGTSAHSSEGNYLFNNIPPGQWYPGSSTIKAC